MSAELSIFCIWNGLQIRKAMKRMLRLVIFACLVFELPVFLQAQDCSSSFKQGDCKMDLQRDYKTFSQSRGFTITPGDTVEMSVVFYGQKDYIFTFCTDKELYPVHCQIIDTETGTMLYDNKDDRYIESLALGMDVTKNLTFRISALASLETASVETAGPGCLGVLFQYKSYGD